MKKGTVIRIVLTIALVALILFVALLYVTDITLRGKDPRDELARMIVIVLTSLVALVRLWGTGGGRPGGLARYERDYGDDLGDAFAERPRLRKKLLRATRLYNEHKPMAAIKLLNSLWKQCEHKDEYHAVGVFHALALTDMGARESAAEVYRSLIAMGAASTTVYGNLGHLCSELGNYEEAVLNLQLSIRCDASNPAPYHNLAMLYFDVYDLESAKEWALKALDVNQKYHLSASLLAVVFSLEGDEVNAQKYLHVAVTLGEDPARLKAAIAHYMAAKPHDGEEAEDGETEENEEEEEGEKDEKDEV